MRIINERKLFWQLFLLAGFLILIITIVAQSVRTSLASRESFAYPAPGAISMVEGEQTGQSVTEAPLPTSNVEEMRPRRIAGSGIIIFGVVSRISPTVFFQTNTWYEGKENEYIYVFAGAKRASDGSQDLSEGAIFIDILNLNREFIPGGGVYPTPIKAGPVTIVDANGEQLTLSTQDGRVLYFNTASRKFINPPGLQADVSVKREVENWFIVEDGRSPFSTPLYKFENQSFRENNGNKITVYVGQENGANGRGVIMVVESRGEPTPKDNPIFFFTPNQATALRIFDIKGDQLILASARGEAYTFDVSTRMLSSPIIRYTPNDTQLATLEAPPQFTHPPTVTSLPKPDLTSTPLQPYP